MGKVGFFPSEPLITNIEDSPAEEDLGIWKFFAQRVVRQGLPRESVDAPSLQVLKARLDGTLANLSWWVVRWLMAEGLELDNP